MERDPRQDPRKGDVISDGYTAYVVLSVNSAGDVFYADLNSLPDRIPGDGFMIDEAWERDAKNDKVVWVGKGGE